MNSARYRLAYLRLCAANDARDAAAVAHYRSICQSILRARWLQ